MLVLIVGVEIFLRCLSLVLSFANYFMVNKVKSIFILKMVRLDLLITSKVVIINLRGIFLMRNRYIHGLLRGKRTLGEVKLGA